MIYNNFLSNNNYTVQSNVMYECYLKLSIDIKFRDTQVHPVLHFPLVRKLLKTSFIKFIKTHTLGTNLADCNKWPSATLSSVDLICWSEWELCPQSYLQMEVPVIYYWRNLVSSNRFLLSQKTLTNHWPGSGILTISLSQVTHKHFKIYVKKK